MIYKVCPKCGFNFKKEFNYSINIQLLYNERSTSTKKYIKMIIGRIRKLHDITPKDLYFFLFKIKDAPDEVLKYYLNIYFQKNNYIEKGLNYLAQMILNHDKNKDKLLEVERKIHGTKPPKRNIKK